MRVLVVGLNPSMKHSGNPTIKRLSKWLDVLNLRNVSFINLYEDYTIDEKNAKTEFIKEISKDYDRILVLGNKVSNTLHRVDVNHFKLPHPSGLNRKLNDEKFVHEQLELCKNYLYGR